MNISAQFKKFRGFTLIELLIVIAILGILAAAVLVAINPTKRTNQAKDATIQSDVGQIATALSSYLTTSTIGSYPTALTGLTAATSQELKSLPTPPGQVAGTNYTYVTKQADGTTACAETAASVCSTAKVMWVMNDPTGTTDLWCWESTTGKASRVLTGACTPN